MKEQDKIKLFHKYINNQCSKDEFNCLISEFGKEASSDEFDYLFDESIRKVKSGQDTKNNIEQLKVEAERTLALAKKKEGKRKLRINWNDKLFMKAAAVIILFVSSTLIWHQLSQVNSSDEQAIAVVSDQLLEKSTSFGEISNVSLSDGSKIKLNAGTKIHFNEKFRGTKREVTLTGQAFFNVTKDPQKPFVINSGELAVEVLGTSFDVKSFEEDNYSTVTVVTGKVKVSSGDDVIFLVPNEQVRLSKKTGELRKMKVNSEEFIKWTDGTLYFKQTPVSDVVKQLERWYNVSINVQDPSILSLKVTGEHTNENLRSVLKAMEFSIDINYEIKDDIIYLTKSNS